jgi:hypothetical protein
MKKTTKILVLFFIIYGAMVFSQEKYFTINNARSSKTAYGGISYLKGDRIVLNFKGKNKKQFTTYPCCQRRNTGNRTTTVHSSRRQPQFILAII